MGQRPTHRDESALLTARLIPNELCNDFRGSVIAFHEKAGRSQGNSLFEASCSFFSVAKILLPPSSRCRHASIRTLEERIISLGAYWAFSIQPVLPSVWRPVASLKSGTWPRRLTQSPELGFGFCLFSSWNDFDLVLLGCFYADAATVMRRLLCKGSYTSPLTHR
jgi:hypothetical protein